MTDLQAQYLLLYLGYAPGGADGIWGKNSATACKRFQADYGISASGTLDGDTQKELIRAVAGTAEKKKSGSFGMTSATSGVPIPILPVPAGSAAAFLRNQRKS